MKRAKDDIETRADTPSERESQCARGDLLSQSLNPELETIALRNLVLTLLAGSVALTEDKKAIANVLRRLAEL